MDEPLLVATGVVCRFGGVRALDGVSISIAAGAVTGLIGPNGAGKTTLVNVLTGLVRPQEGRIHAAGVDITGLPPHRVAALGIARTFQNIRLYKAMSVLDNVIAGGHLHRRRAFPRALFPVGGSGALGDELRRDALALIGRVGLDPGVAGRPAGTLPYGDQRRLEIARALALRPRALVLDEPAAGMNAAEKSGLADLITGLAHQQHLGLLLIEHDIRFVTKVCRDVVVLDFGRCIARGTPERVAEAPAVAAAYIGTGSTGGARAGRNGHRLAVISEPGTAAPRCGGATPPSALLSVDGLHVAYGAIAAVRGVTLSLRDGEVVALLGANGAGKSTLLRTLSGLKRPTAGAARFDGLDLGRASPSAIVRRGLVQVPEGREILSRLTVRENLALGAWPRRPDSPGPRIRAVRRRRGELAAEVEGLLTRFPLLAQRADTPAGALSGGEQQILAIARALLAGPRLLMLDEPSLGLAPTLAAEVFDLVGEIAAEGVTVLLVEQNASAALDLADRAYVIEGGQIQKEGAATSLRRDPDVRAAYLGT